MRAWGHELVGVGPVRQVLAGEDERLREASVLALMLVGIALDLLQDAVVGVRHVDLLLNVGGREGALIFEHVQFPAAALPLDVIHLIAGLEEHAVDPHPRADPHGIVIDEVPFVIRPFVLVAIDDVLELGHGVSGRRGG